MFFSSKSKSGNNSNEQMVQYVLVAIVVALVLYYFISCIRDNKRNNNSNKNTSNNNSNNNTNNNTNSVPVNEVQNMVENVDELAGYQNLEGFQNNEGPEDVEAAEAREFNNNPEPVQAEEVGNELPAECYPKDVLASADLLPNDANSTWAQTNPNGQGSLTDKNFLNAGFHVGVNTVGQSLRNANRQLRSDPPNPQVKVSPWMQTTIEPDVNRKPMEIGA